MARRSARLSKAPQANVNKPLPKEPQLGSVLEREESAEEEDQIQSIGNVLHQSAESEEDQQIEEMTKLDTPKTAPRPTKTDMHPKSAYVSTAPSPMGSGKRLGFKDITQPRISTASAQNTPSHSANKQSPAPAFTFGSESILSREAKKMMENVREDAARIKAEMKAQKDLQDARDGEAEAMYNPYGRKLARPKAKAGRFSDVHMAEFKKMDSIANHPSSFRARPGYAQPTTTQSLKRSPSKAGLDELERPQTAGKGTPGKQLAGSFGRPLSRGTYHSIPQSTAQQQSSSPAKRARRSEHEDVSTTRTVEEPALKPSGIPKSTSSLFSPTKASLARAAQSSPGKPSMLPRSQPAKGLREKARQSMGRTSAAMSKFTSKLLEVQNEVRREQPSIRKSASAANLFSPQPQAKLPPVAPMTVGPSFSSRLPTFSGLKSILRSPHKASGDRQGTPKRPTTAAGIPETTKKVDFTPSVKSRYAVKLTNNSPSPAKFVQPEEADRRASRGSMFSSAAYTLPENHDESWEDASSSPVEYPILPSLSHSSRAGPVVHTVDQRLKDLPRPGSKDFKSIFTDLHPKRSAHTQAAATTAPNSITRSPKDTSTRPSRPSTIKRVRSSNAPELVEPFADTEVATMAHGLPAKKRRRESMYFDTHEDAQEASKENQPVPGAWDDGEESGNEGAKRSKRTKTFEFKDIDTTSKLPMVSPKKKSAAREAAARSARDRKSMVPGQQRGTPGRGLSMSRLNMLSQPKTR